MVNVNDIKNGMTVEDEGNLYQVLDFSHVKPGKGAAFVKMKLKNLRTGAIVEKTYNSSVKLAKAMVQRKPMQYLYQAGDSYSFMDMNTYEQVELNANQIGANLLSIYLVPLSGASENLASLFSIYMALAICCF